MTRKDVEPIAVDAGAPGEIAESGEAQAKERARTAVEPCMTAALVAQAYGKTAFEGISVTETQRAIQEKAERVHDGNMREVESTLVAQAAALNSMFTHLARRATRFNRLPQIEAFMKLALRAQNQSRMTLETLATIKNPPVVFAKQANIAAGHQQVNNGEAVPFPRARVTSNPPIELSRITHDGQSLDCGATATAGRGNPALATLDAQHRPQD